MVVEHLFGKLKNIFRRIQDDVHVNIEKVENIVVSSCTLHNICCLQKEAILWQKFYPR
jgi:hypothetical protein